MADQKMFITIDVNADAAKAELRAVDAAADKVGKTATASGAEVDRALKMVSGSAQCRPRSSAASAPSW